MTLGPFAGKIRTDSWRGPDPRRRCCGAGACDSGRCGIRVVRLANQLHSLGGTKSKGPSMSIKFEGKPPFYLGIAELASAHALDGSIVLRATISVPELRPKSVSVQFLLATAVANASWLL
jgi:hypothetical protein